MDMKSPKTAEKPSKKPSPLTLQGSSKSKKSDTSAEDKTRSPTNALPSPPMKSKPGSPSKATQEPPSPRTPDNKSKAGCAKGKLSKTEKTSPAKKLKVKPKTVSSKNKMKKDGKISEKKLKDSVNLAMYKNLPPKKRKALMLDYGNAVVTGEEDRETNNLTPGANTPTKLEAILPEAESPSTKKCKKKLLIGAPDKVAKKRGRPKGSKNKVKNKIDEEGSNASKKNDPFAKVSKEVKGPKAKLKGESNEDAEIMSREMKVKRLAALVSAEVDHYVYNTDDGSSEFEDYSTARQALKLEKNKSTSNKTARIMQMESTAGDSGWETFELQSPSVKKSSPKKPKDNDCSSNVRSAIESVLIRVKMEQDDVTSEVECTGSPICTSTPKSNATKTQDCPATERVMKEDSCADDEESEDDVNYAKKQDGSKKSGVVLKRKMGPKKKKFSHKNLKNMSPGKAVTFASEDDESSKESESDGEGFDGKKKKGRLLAKKSKITVQRSVKPSPESSPSPLRRTARMASLNARAVMHCMNEDARMPFHAPRHEPKKQEMSLVLRTESTIAKRHTDDDSDEDDSDDDTVHIRRLQPGKRKKDNSAAKMKTVRKKRRGELDVQMDIRDMVVTKRMASLNASAIMAASYCVESRKRTPSHAASSSAESEFTNLNIKRKISYKSTKSKVSKSSRSSVITVQETTKKLKKAEGTRETEVEERIIVKKKVKRHSERSTTHDDTDRDDDDDNVTDGSELNHDEIIPKSPEDGGMIVESTITYITTQTDTLPPTAPQAGASPHCIAAGDRQTTTVVHERKSKTTTKCTAYSTGAPPTAFIPPTHYVQPVVYSSAPGPSVVSKSTVSYSPLGALSGMQPTVDQPSSLAPLLQPSRHTHFQSTHMPPHYPTHHLNHHHHHVHSHHPHHHMNINPSSPQPGYPIQPQQVSPYSPSSPQHQYLQPHSPPYPPPPLPASAAPPTVAAVSGRTQPQQQQQQQQVAVQKQPQQLQPPVSHHQQQQQQQHYMHNNHQQMQQYYPQHQQRMMHQHQQISSKQMNGGRINVPCSSAVNSLTPQHQFAHHQQQMQTEQHMRTQVKMQHQQQHHHQLQQQPMNLPRHQQQFQTPTCRPPMVPANAANFMPPSDDAHMAPLPAPHHQHQLQQPPHPQYHYPPPGLSPDAGKLMSPSALAEANERHQSAFTAPAVPAVTDYQPVTGPIPTGVGETSSYKAPVSAPGSSGGCLSNVPFSSSGFSSPSYSSPPFSAPIYSTTDVSPPYTSPPYASSPALRAPPSNSSRSSSPLPSYPSAESYASPSYSYPPYQGYPPPAYANNKPYQGPSYPQSIEGYPQRGQYVPYPPQYESYSFQSHSLKTNPLALPPPPPPSGNPSVPPGGNGTSGSPRTPYRPSLPPPPYPDFTEPTEPIGVAGGCCGVRLEMGKNPGPGGPFASRPSPSQASHGPPSQLSKDAASKSRQPALKTAAMPTSKHLSSQLGSLKQGTAGVTAKNAELIDLECSPPSSCRRQQQSPDSSGRSARESSPASHPGILSSSYSEEDSKSSFIMCDSQRLTKTKISSNDVQSKRDSSSSTMSCTSKREISAANSSIAATLANLRKLNSCTITSANVLPSSPFSQEDSSPMLQVSSETQSLVSAKISSNNSKTSLRVSPHAKSSPQVPSINSTTSNPLLDSKDELAPTTAALRDASANIRTKKPPPPPEILSNQRLKPASDVYNSKMSATCNGVGANHRGNLKNSCDIRRSIASALPHLSASMIVKEVDSSAGSCSDKASDIEVIDRTQMSSEDIQATTSASSPLMSTSSRPLLGQDSRDSDSPCLPFPSDDATDLSVANDLLLLSQSDLQFSSNSSFLPASCSVSVSSTSIVEHDSQLSSSVDRPLSRSSSSSKVIHTSRTSLERSNSNSPNPRFGARHLLCQMVPAHSQSKNATARAKPLNISPGQKKLATHIKAEVTENNADNGCVAPNFTSTKRKVDLVPNDEAKSRNNLVTSQQSSTSSGSSPVRKRGRPPKIKDKPAHENESVVTVKNSTLSNNIRCDSKNVRAHGESSSPQSALIHQFKIKITEEKESAPQKLSPSKADSKDSKLDINNLDLKRSLQVKTESVTKIKSEKVSPNASYSGDFHCNKFPVNNYKLANGNLGSVNYFPEKDVDRLIEALGVENLSCGQSQIPSSCEQLNFVLSEHTKAQGGKFKPSAVKRSCADETKVTKSDSSSSREGSNPPNRNTKPSKQQSKSSKQAKGGKVARKTTEVKSRCKNSLLAYLKEKNEHDSSNVDSDVPSSTEPGACNSSAAGDSESKSRVGAKAAGPGAFPSFPSKGIRRRSSSGTGKSKMLKKPKYSHGWSWEGEPYQGKIWLRNDEVLITRTCYTAMQHKEGDLVRVRDCVLLRSGPRKADLPFVAKVAALWEDPDTSDMMMSILWYYRPEHTELGRQAHDLSDEIFASKHRDHLSVACIEDTCYVLTFNEYCR
ncbi:uncharacterized protein LOC108665765 [Hyalella azteca]|uniref:Uncharacterized protein LOC108665765 n=1 Tax=Hyalella azteca TaxID=294128 RepID=A0A979FGL8_HYAAZ|nr:uncharacterized protein LOC108665765 [Hyalella azteca]